MPRGPLSLKNLLEQSSGTASLLHRARDHVALLSRVTTELDPALREHVSAALSKGPLLMLYVDSPAWASRLRFSSRSLRARLMKIGMRFDKVRVRVLLDLPPPSRKRLSPRNLSRDNAGLIRQLAEDIEDEPLRSALERLSLHGR